jgi:hypothetical protein
VAELETKDEARQALERALELYAAAEVPDQVLDAIGRFLLAHSHARPNEARVRVVVNTYTVLDRKVDLNLHWGLRVEPTLMGLPSSSDVRVEVNPEGG